MTIKTGISIIGFLDILSIVANAILIGAIIATEQYYLILITSLSLLFFVRVPRIVCFFITVCDKRILYKRTCHYICRIITTVVGGFISVGQVIMICLEAEEIFEWMNDSYIVAIILTVTSYFIYLCFDIYFIFVARQYRENLLFKLAKMRLTELSYLNGLPGHTHSNLNLSRMSLTLPTNAYVTPNKSISRFDPVVKMEDDLRLSRALSVPKAPPPNHDVLNNISLLQVQIDYLKDQYQR